MDGFFYIVEKYFCRCRYLAGLLAILANFIKHKK